ncbi:hypothetical protein AGMMS50230_22660 [Spirochaetia bacterium]|nr:hypothetical protein AGMMS50230_22660 [Spirochaetia bacterium]
MNTSLLTIIKRIIAEQGEDILANPQRLKIYVKDYAKNEPKEERIAFGRCIEAGCYSELKKAKTTETRLRFKAVLSKQLQKITGLDSALCNDALDLLDAVLPAAQSSVPRRKFSVLPGIVRIWSAVKKQKIRSKVLITAGAALIVGLGIFIAVKYRPQEVDDNDIVVPVNIDDTLVLDEHNNIIFTQEKNYDELISGLNLTLNDVKAVQKYITQNFPNFDFEKEGYETDDYRNELLVMDFNNNPQVMNIYLGGIKEMAGFSSAYAHLSIDGDNADLRYYFVSVDQEFSDTSGFEYYNGRYGLTSKVDDKITSISVYRYLYIDTDEPYWIIRWDDDISAQERFTLLKNFLNVLSYTKVYQNLGRAFFANIQTGIEQHQTLADIKNAKPPVVRPAVVRKPDPVPTVETRIKQALVQTKEQVRDVNRDGKINCIDYTVTFYSIYGPEAKMMRIYNNDLNHLFIRVGNRDIEPQRLDGSMENAWGSRYKPGQSWDETHEWSQYAF